MLAADDPVIVFDRHSVMHIVLNRPEALNSLDVHMIRIIGKALDDAEKADDVKAAILYGSGERGFCAGGDIKLIARSVADDSLAPAMQFFEEEYALDLRIHSFKKPLVVLADGITMGGGLGLAAGSDMVIATERTRMAMPETRIGFFPDVGATGWLFRKCPPGYPEFLALTGYESTGSECVRVGLATHFVPSERLREVVKGIEAGAEGIAPEKEEGRKILEGMLKKVLIEDIPVHPDMDAWVRTYFSGRASVLDLLEDLKQCSIEQELCKGVFDRLSQMSPSAVVLTLALLRHNENRDIDDVYKADLMAARYLTGRHDFREGVRARLIDRDDRPLWIPQTFDEASALFDPSAVFR
ncbi:MAG TPA: enoyl-CoA hydratase/isomerase family protein [Deltaproteobacteria bacterium]|jgi:enoyl-CoA hydratase/carnithine racemase|nr:enoyl-CoA hydratase/isomerase family protein [Deltaproteobacteria bacterium]